MAVERARKDKSHPASLRSFPQWVFWRFPINPGLPFRTARKPSVFLANRHYGLISASDRASRRTITLASGDGPLDPPRNRIALAGDCVRRADSSHIPSIVRPVRLVGLSRDTYPGTRGSAGGDPFLCKCRARSCWRRLQRSDPMELPDRQILHEEWPHLGRDHEQAVRLAMIRSKLRMVSQPRLFIDTLRATEARRAGERFPAGDMRRNRCRSKRGLARTTRMAGKRGQSFSS